MDARVGGVTPERLLIRRATWELLEDGFSRQKTRYARAPSEALLDGLLDLEALCSLDDAGVRETLVALPGIGPRTAEVYSLGAAAPGHLADRRRLAAGGGAARTGHRRASVGGRAGADRERWWPQAPPRRACSGTSTSPSADAAKRYAATGTGGCSRRPRRGSSRRRADQQPPAPGAAARSEQRGRADTCENGGVAHCGSSPASAGRPRQQPEARDRHEQAYDAHDHEPRAVEDRGERGAAGDDEDPARVTPRPARSAATGGSAQATRSRTRWRRARRPAPTRRPGGSGDRNRRGDETHQSGEKSRSRQRATVGR